MTGANGTTYMNSWLHIWSWASEAASMPKVMLVQDFFTLWWIIVALQMGNPPSEGGGGGTKKRISLVALLFGPWNFSFCFHIVDYLPKAMYIELGCVKWKINNEFCHKRKKKLGLWELWNWVWGKAREFRLERENWRNKKKVFKVSCAKWLLEIHVRHLTIFLGR